MRSAEARACCPGQAARGEEAEVWRAAVTPLGEMTPFPPSSPVR